MDNDERQWLYMTLDDAVRHIGHLIDVIHESAMHCKGGVACLPTPEPNHSRLVDFHRDSPLSVPRITEASVFLREHCDADTWERAFPSSSLPNQAMLSAEENLPGFTRMWNESLTQYRAEEAERIANIPPVEEESDV